jgi:conjugative relaxase-like TrwC/TraI family protein
VGAEHFARLSEGQHPNTQEQLVRHQVSKTYEGKNGKDITSVEHRAGWDATFSAPKSVSLTALVGGDDRVRQAHRESVRVALTELERYTEARIGNIREPETTGKFAAATFEHDTARPVEGYAAPQLHTHAVTRQVHNLQPALEQHPLFASREAEQFVLKECVRDENLIRQTQKDPEQRGLLEVDETTAVTDDNPHQSPAVLSNRLPPRAGEFAAIQRPC